MTDKIRVVVEGFTTMTQAEAFADWYGGAGEQDASFWFEARKEEGEIDVDWMGTDGPLVKEDNDIIMKIKPQ